MTEWNKTTKHIVGVGMVLFGLYLLYLSGPVLKILAIAALMAFLLMPVVTFLHQRLKIPRVLATLLAALKARGGTKGVASLCIGGGEAVAMAVELA